MQKITYVSAGNDGHRSEYDRLFNRIFQEARFQVDYVIDADQSPEHTNLLFYSMIDTVPGQTFSSLIRTIARSILGRKTVGLFFRPGDCIYATGLKYKIKKMLFRITAHLPHVSILTILPFEICPDFSKIATNGIYDPQLWDLQYLGASTDGAPDLQRQIVTAAQGRRIVIALGGQNYSKGFDCMVDLWCSSSEVRDSFLFVATGKVSADSLGKARQFEQNSGFLLNRFIDNNELFALYQLADIVWSCYAPQYNQASGIYGRAVQLGVPVVVREGSYLEKLGEMIGHPTLALGFDDPHKAADNLLAWYPSPTDEETLAKMVTKMREHSLAILAKAIGAAHPTEHAHTAPP